MSSTLSCLISGVSYQVKSGDTYGDLNVYSALEVRGSLDITIIDYDGVYSFVYGQPVVLSDSVLGTLFEGFVGTDKPTKLGPASTTVEHALTCFDKQYLVDKRTNYSNYLNWYAGDIIVDFVQNTLAAEGVTVAAAMRHESTYSDFSAGTFSGIAASTNVDDGDLELTPAGSTVTYSEKVTADFATGTLTNCTATDDTLVPTSTNAIKMVAVQSLAGTNSTSAVSSVMIWSGSQAVSNTGQTWIEYDMFIDPAAPEAKMSLNFLLSNGTDFAAVATDNGANEDGQFILPDASNDLAGLATTGWYHRKHSITTYDTDLAQWTGAGGKTISAIMIVCKGSQPGTYTGYFKNIKLTGVSGGTNATITPNTTQQLQSYGFSSTDVTTVPTYDLYVSTADQYGAIAYKATTNISIDAVKLYRTSFISWIAIVPDKCSLVVKYNIDGVNGDFIACTNGAELPNLPSGLDVSGKSIQLQYQFYYLPGALPDSVITLEQVDLSVEPSYAATKTDVTYSVLIQTDWDAGTKTNTVSNSKAELTLNGILRTWDDSSTASQTMYASGIQNQSANNRAFTFWNIPNGSNVEVRSRFDFAGQWQNFTAEVDVQLSPDDPVQHGFVYRTTNWQTHAGSAAYYVWVTPVFIALGKGTNSTGSAASAQTIITSKVLAISVNSWHRLKVVVSGNSHQVYLDGILMLSATDSTYTASGYMGVYTTDGGSTNTDVYTVFFDNFGVTSALSGTWLSPATSLASVGTYGDSIITWRDKSPSYNGLTNTTILVEASYDNGSTWQTCTNGEALPNLTVGQSLASANLKIRVTLTTTSASSLPAIDNLVVRVLGQYSSSGTRTTAPIGIDYVDRANQSNWGTASDGQTWAKTGTGTAAVASNTLTLANTTGDVYERLGSLTGADMDATVPFKLSASDDIAGMTLRYVDANNHYKIAVSTTNITISKKVSGVTTTLAIGSLSLSTNTWYNLRFRVVGMSPVLLYGNVWLQGTLENTIDSTTYQWNDNNWTLTASD